jgi:hypothetical protein
MASSRFLERYLAGEHVSVWRELIELGDNVRNEPLRSEALRVCEEIVRRARFNLRTLHARLLDLGYEFAEPHAALVDAGPNAAAEIEKAEQEWGAFPLIAQAWYRTFASVNFCQAERQRFAGAAALLKPPPGPDIFGLGSHSVLLFQSLDRCREDMQQSEAAREENLRYAKQQGWDEKDVPESVVSCQFLSLGGDASNCELKEFELPCFGVDGVIFNDGGGDTYFVDELRSAFQWGGFPFWKSIFTKPDFFSPMEYRPNFEKLLPVLKEGLLEL